MYYKVKIKKLPNKALGGTKTGQQNSDGSLAIQPTAMGGSNIDSYIGEPDVEVKKNLGAVPRPEANLEAEGGETAYGDINGDGMLEHYNIVGPRHNAGGVPLNLPDDSFIYSDFVKMKIKDPDMLAKFGKATGKGKKSKGYTPAELAKQYDINKYRQILQDPNSDSLDRKTAEMMIKNYNMKLGALALAQEGSKAFPQGIPEVAKPFMEANGISEEQILPKKPQAAPTEMPSGEPIAQAEPMPGEAMPEAPMAMYGMTMGGYGLPFAQDGAITNNAYTEDLSQSLGTQGMSERDRRISQKPYYHFEPQTIANPDEDRYWLTMGDRLKNLKAFITGEEPPMSSGVSYKFQKGGAPYTEAEGYSPKGVERLNMYRRMYGLPQLKGQLTKEDIQQAAGELQSKIIETNPELVVDYMSRTSHQPNKKLIDLMKSKNLSYPKTTEGVKQAFDEGKLSAEDIRQAYKDDKWWYRALETNLKELSKEEYEEKMKQEGAIEQNGKLYFQDDPDNPQLYTEYVMKDGVPVATEEKKTEEELEAERPDIVNPEFAQQPGVVAPEWMTPDKMNFYGTLKDKYSINKYYPWAARFEPEVPRPVFESPERALAANAEQANIASQALSQFAGPQAMSARAASIQGQGAKTAADILANYNTRNVGIANQFAMNEASIRNQAQLQNQAIAKQLYDQTTTTNQQFDNSMRVADQAKRLAFATGWKNASDLAMVNATSDQYDIDPVTGAVVFTGGKENKPELAKDFNYWLDVYKTDYGMSDKEAIAAAKIASGQASSGYYGPTMQDMIGQKGLIVTGGMTYPFIL